MTLYTLFIHRGICVTTLPGGSLATYCTTHARVHTFKMDPKWRKPRANLVEKHTLNGVNRVKNIP